MGLVMSPHVLVVDDEPSVRAWMRIELERDGWTVDTVADGAAALEHAAASRPDVAVVDQRMPGMTGIETIEQLRRDGFTGPAILFSALLDSHETESADRLEIRTMSKLARSDLLRVLAAHRAELA